MGLAISFWVFGAIAILAALGVVFIKNVFHAALTLILCFLMVAGLYVTLSADFLAAVQVLIYVGAISVLIILAIMMTREFQRGSEGNRFQTPAFIVAALFLGVLAYALMATNWPISGAAPIEPTTDALAFKLLGKGGFVLPVQIAALLLLSAVLGAIVIAREK